MQQFIVCTFHPIVNFGSRYALFNDVRRCAYVYKNSKGGEKFAKAKRAFRRKIIARGNNVSYLMANSVREITFRCLSPRKLDRLRIIGVFLSLDGVKRNSFVNYLKKEQQ